MSRLMACACALLAVAAAAAPSHAQRPFTQTQELRVSYADLDLNRQQGAQTLLDRLSLAATHVCGGKPDIRDLAGMTYYHRCYRESLGNAVATVHSPLLVALYDGKPLPAAKPQQNVAVNTD